MVATRATFGHLPWREWRHEHRQATFLAVTSAVIVACGVAFVALMSHTPRGPAPGTFALGLAPPHADDLSYANQQVDSLLEDQRALLSEICWQRDQSSPSDVWAATVRFVFDPRGRQVDREVIESAGSTRHDVTDCVVENLDALALSPPLGEEVTIQTSWSLP